MTSEQTTTQAENIQTKTWKTLLANFEMKTYNGFEVIAHSETGYVNATKLCHNICLKEGKRVKDFFHIKKSPQFLDYCAYLSGKQGPTKSEGPRKAVENYFINPELDNLVEVVNGKGYPNDVKGQYVHQLLKASYLKRT